MVIIFHYWVKHYFYWCSFGQMIQYILYIKFGIIFNQEEWKTFQKMTMRKIVLIVVTEESPQKITDKSNMENRTQMGRMRFSCNFKMVERRWTLSSMSKRLFVIPIFNVRVKKMGVREVRWTNGCQFNWKISWSVSCTQFYQNLLISDPGLSHHHIP